MSGSENCRQNFIITWFCHTNSPSTCANYPVPSKWLHFTSPLLRHNFILSWKPDGGIFGLFRETNHLFIPSAFSGRKAGGHSVWASATLTCCHICHCTKGDKGIKCVLPRSDRSPALRSALLCLCLFEVLKHLGLFFLLIISPRLCLFILLPDPLKWPKWFPSVNRRDCRTTEICVDVFFRLSDTFATNGHTPLWDNALVWSGQGWAFGWCIVL